MGAKTPLWVGINDKRFLLPYSRFVLVHDRTRSGRLPQRPCVFGQQVWSAKHRTAKRSRPPRACHVGEKVSALFRATSATHGTGPDGVALCNNKRILRAPEQHCRRTGRPHSLHFDCRWGSRRRRIREVLSRMGRAMEDYLYLQYEQGGMDRWY